MSRPIYVVSGVPRSGTSLLMRMLTAGGLPPLADDHRPADIDNPRGYYELESVKRTGADASWVAEAPGRVVKVISYLLRDLPDRHQYQVVFMRRNLDEVLRSQRAMLERRAEPPGGDDDTMRETLVRHIGEVEQWLRGAAHGRALFVSYNRLVADAAAEVERLCKFFDHELDAAAMAAAVEPALYRQRAKR